MLDATFIIPFGADTPDRVRNLDFVIPFLQKHTRAQIFLGELAAEPTVRSRYANVQYFFYEDSSTHFHRTRLLNLLLRQVETSVVINYDTDVFFTPRAYSDAYEMIITGGADIVYPYSGRFLNVHPLYIDLVNRERVSLEHLPGKVMHESSAGGAIFFNRDAYISGGLENERFVAYAPEDLERLDRFSKLGYRINRLPGACYHLHHERTVNSTVENPYFQGGMMEYERIRRLTRRELESEIKAWPWAGPHDSWRQSRPII